MGQLRTILILRSAFAAFFVVLGGVLVATGTVFFGCFTLVVGVTNIGLVVLFARRAQGKNPDR